MPMSTLQLRVLTGPQKGAKARLENGVYVLGTSARADFVLRGEGLLEQHAEMQVGDGTLLLREFGPLETTRPIKRGEPFMLGGLLFVADESTAPWPELPEQIEAVPDLPSELVASAEEIARYHERTTPIAPPPKRRYGAYTIPLLVGGLVACVPIALVLLANAGLEASAPVRPAPQDPLVPLRAQLNALGHSDYLRLGVASDGVLALGGYVQNSDQRLAATRWARNLPYDARISLFAIDEMRAAADEALARTALPLAITLAADGTGQLTGVSTNQDAADKAALLLREDVPGLRTLENRVVTLETMQTDIAAALATAGSQTPAVTLKLDGSQIIASGSLDGAGLAAWRKLKPGIATQLGGTSRLTDHVKPAAAVAASRRRIQNLPIMALVGGPMPFIILDDGTKVQEGGQFGEGYTLVAVGPRALTIREPGGAESLFDLP